MILGLLWPEKHIMIVTFVSTGLGNDLVPEWHQAITKTNTDLTLMSNNINCQIN